MFTKATVLALATTAVTEVTTTLPPETVVQTLQPALGWPAAVAIVGSVVTIIIGICTYLINASKSQPPASVPEQPHIQTSGVEIKIDNLQKQIDDHEKRDIRDFEIINGKFDKLQELLVKILSDDRL